MDRVLLSACYRLLGLTFLSKRANAVVAIVRVVVAQRTVGVDVADIVRIGRYKLFPNSFNCPYLLRAIL